MASFRRECCPFVALYLAVFDWKVQRFCWPKDTSLECAESICVKFTETACVCDELYRLLKKKKKKKLYRCWTNREFRRFVYKACTGPYSFLKPVRVVVLEYS